MRSWKVVGKYQIRNNDEITHTEIALASETGAYASFTERVVGNHLDKSEEELIELAKSAFFKSEYADRAMSESVQKVDELQASINASKKEYAEVQKSLKDLKDKSEEEEASRKRIIENKEAFLKALADSMTEITVQQGVIRQANKDQADLTAVQIKEANSAILKASFQTAQLLSDVIEIF